MSNHTNDYSTKTYVISWDCTGLESVVCLTDIEKEATWNSLKKNYNYDDNGQGRSDAVNSIVYTLTLRAKFNTQRFYEIYLIDVDESVDESYIRQMFDDAPQAAADLMRNRGRMLYSDRPKKEYFKIT